METGPVPLAMQRTTKRGITMAKKMTRREFLAASAATGAGLVMTDWLLRAPLAYAFYQSPTGLQKFAQPLRGVGPGGIPVALADASAAPVTGVTHYSLAIGQFTDQLHPTLGSTTLWGYRPAVALGGGAQPQKHLGGIIVAQRGTALRIHLGVRADGRALQHGAGLAA